MNGCVPKDDYAEEIFGELERFVATTPSYGSPHVVFPESIATLDTSLYVK